MYKNIEIVLIFYCIQDFTHFYLSQVFASLFCPRFCRYPLSFSTIWTYAAHAPMQRSCKLWLKKPYMRWCKIVSCGQIKEAQHDTAFQRTIEMIRVLAGKVWQKSNLTQDFREMSQQCGQRECNMLRSAQRCMLFPEILRLFDRDLRPHLVSYSR